MTHFMHNGTGMNHGTLVQYKSSKLLLLEIFTIIFWINVLFKNNKYSFKTNPARFISRMYALPVFQLDRRTFQVP